MPVPYSAVIGAQLIGKMRRECPHCGAEVITRLEEKDLAVECLRCGEPVPPKQSE